MMEDGMVVEEECAVQYRQDREGRRGRVARGVSR